MDRWRGKVAIVTGASSGIGEAIVKKLVEEGINVAGFARRSERVEELSKNLANKKGKLFAVKCDITKEDDIIKGFQWVAENMGPVHILVNNAGVLRLGTLTEGKTEDWKQIFDTNVLGLCICTREAVKSLKENNIDGHIVHINSIAGHCVGDFPKLNVYFASKFAVTALTDTLRREFNFDGSKIKVTSVSPGAVQTEILTSHDFDPEIMKDIPVLQSEDVADAVLFAIGTAPHILIQELIIRPVGEKF